MNCASGDESVSQTDLSVGGRGPGLHLTRTYNSQAAVAATSPGPFGYGWSGPYSAHTEETEATKVRTVYNNSGAAFRFEKREGSWVAVSPVVESTLRQEGTTFIFTQPDQTVLRFGSEGHLTSIADRDGNTVTMHWSGSQLESVSDEASRSLTFKYHEGLVVEAKDPMGHTVKYGYNVADELETVTEPGETSPRWTFKYNSERELTSETDGRKQTIEREYDSSHRVKSETDAMGRKRTWEYSAAFGTEGEITTIDEPNGSITREVFNIWGEPTEITRAYETSLATTVHDYYNTEGRLVGTTNPDGNSTTYTYDAAGNRTSETTPEGSKTRWGYNSTHDIIAETSPLGETTTIERDTHGDPLKISKSASETETETTKYAYYGHGELESLENAEKHTWYYKYDSYGDRSTETDPEGDERTWEFDADSNETATVSPRGHVTGAKEEEFKTTIKRDEQERPIKVTNPLKAVTTYEYDGNGNLEHLTDGNEHTTAYTYDADSELTKTTEPNGVTTETGYDKEGQITSQTNGEKHTTEYTRNALGEITVETDPRGRKTSKKYDAAGNLTTVVDPRERTTTYSYTANNLVAGVSYSDGTTHAVAYSYNTAGSPLTMTDGTGKTTYEYDQLDRLTKETSGHGATVSYEYNLVNQPTEITYPNSKAVTRTYDSDGRLKTVKDWLEHTTSFGYNADSDQTTTKYPSGTSEEDLTTLNAADQVAGIEMNKGSEVLASLVYKRDADGQVTSTTSTGLPGESKVVDKYDEANRLTKAGSVKYSYNNANDITGVEKEKGTYSSDDELERLGTTSYAYNEDGQRGLDIPTGEATTTLLYDQAGNLISSTRPKSGEAPEINDSYTYTGEHLRASQDVNGTTTYLTWDTATELPLILSDEADSYIYGPADIPIEQISSSGSALFFHHDQQGSTRMLTGATGAVEHKASYGAYGAVEGSSGSATTTLGYDGQYTSADTGFIYLRARTYDPMSAQFLSVDPEMRLTRARYTFGGDTPLNMSDPSGLCPGFGPAVGGCSGSARELASRVFCVPNKREVVEEKREREEREREAREAREKCETGVVEAAYGLPHYCGEETNEGFGSPPYDPVNPKPPQIPFPPRIPVPRLFDPWGGLTGAPA